MLLLPRTGHTAVWTSVEMIIWGGYDGNNDPNTGGRYNPNTDILDSYNDCQCAVWPLSAQRSLDR